MDELFLRSILLLMQCFMPVLWRSDTALERTVRQGNSKKRGFRLTNGWMLLCVCRPFRAEIDHANSYQRHNQLLPVVICSPDLLSLLRRFARPLDGIHINISLWKEIFGKNDFVRQFMVAMQIADQLLNNFAYFKRPSCLSDASEWSHFWVLFMRGHLGELMDNSCNSGLLLISRTFRIPFIKDWISRRLVSAWRGLSARQKRE